MIPTHAAIRRAITPEVLTMKIEEMHEAYHRLCRIAVIETPGSYCDDLEMEGIFSIVDLELSEVRYRHASDHTEAAFRVLAKNPKVQDRVDSVLWTMVGEQSLNPKHFPQNGPHCRLCFLWINGVRVAIDPDACMAAAEGETSAFRG